MVAIPIPGKPVRGSKSGAPIMALFDLLGRRWAMGILWTLNQAGPLTFRELQQRCETISPTVLNTRLKELREARLKEHVEDGYRPSDIGRELYGLIVPLGTWSREWGKCLQPEE